MRRAIRVLSILGWLAAAGCDGSDLADAGADASSLDASPPADSGSPRDGGARRDGGRDAAPDGDAGERDASTALDASGPDASLTADAGQPDAGADDAGLPDAGALDAGSLDAGFALPSSCATSPECGASATCVSSRCVCNATLVPCGGGCCPFLYERDLTLAEGGHAPEIGADAEGNVFVLYKVGSSSVRLATLPAGSTTATTEVVATSSGLIDDADLAVSPDGTVMVAVHRPGTDRSGLFTLYARARGASGFTATSLRPGAPDVFAFDAAVSLSLAPGGDLYAGASARSGDGTQGLAMVRYDATAGSWINLGAVLTVGAYARSELFARDDGFFLGVYDFAGGTYYYEDLDAAAVPLDYLAGTVSTSTHGHSAAAITDEGRLFTFVSVGSSGALALSDGSLSEAVEFSSSAGGLRSDIDMALDQDGNPVLLVHSATHHAISMMVRMPGGGFTRYSWFDASFLPPATTSSWMTLDAERLPNGNLAFVFGDSMDRGELHYREIAR